MRPGTRHALRSGTVLLLAARLGLGPAEAQTPGAQTPAVDPSAPVPAEGPTSQAWHLALRPYLFLSGVSGSITTEPLTFPINSTVGDLVDNLQIGAYVAFIAERERWGVYADFQYTSLVGEGTGLADTKIELENLIVEADAIYRSPDIPTLRFVAGVRAYSIEQSVTVFGAPLPTAKTTVIDPILGAVGEWPLGDSWDFEMRGDVGGFGISSEFTYQLMILFDWAVNGTLGIPFGYRILGYQVKTDDIWMNTQLSGLVLGLDIRF